MYRKMRIKDSHHGTSRDGGSSEFTAALPLKYYGEKLKKQDRWTDLHIHTNKSDGTFSVEDVFKSAKREGLEAISITDHDTVAAVTEGLKFSNTYGIEFVPGVELSAIYQNKEVHIIGLFIDWKDKAFNERLTYFQKKRAERAKKIIKKLRELGLPVKYEEMYEVTENMNNAGRLHVAKLLVQKKLAKNIRNAFDRYLAEERPAYVKKAKLTVKEAIDLIKSVNGISILAHPVLLNRDDMLKEWKQTGLDGLEAFHPDHDSEAMSRYLSLAKKNGLIVSGGSDCHGSSKMHTRIGKIKLPYEFFIKIKELKNKRGKKAS